MLFYSILMFDIIKKESPKYCQFYFSYYFYILKFAIFRSLFFASLNVNEVVIIKIKVYWNAQAMGILQKCFSI